MTGLADPEVVLIETTELYRSPNEFALSDPDETLVRVGWPTRLRRPT
jgi:hypothetical protein